MADTKLSAELSASTLTGAEIFPVVQAGANRKATLNQLVTDLGLGGGGSGGAPTTVDYIVGTASASLSAERVVTDNATIAKDTSVAGQISFTLVDNAVTTAKIAANAVGNARLAKMPANSVKVNNTDLTATGDPVDLVLPASTLLGRDATGDIAAITMGTGIELTGGALNVTATGGGETMASLLAAGMVRVDANGQLINGTGAVISGTPSVADYPAMVALDEALYENYVVVPSAGVNRSAWLSNGTTFTPLNGQYVQERVNDSVVTYIAPNTGLTWTAANNGGKVRLTSSAAHGLTTTPAVGASLCVKTTQNGWTAGVFHEISAIPSTTQIDLTTNFSSHGVPVFYLANEEVTAKQWTVPILRSATQSILEFNVGYSLDAAGSSRRVKFYLGATALNNNNLTSTTVIYTPFRWGFKNLNNVASQRGLSGENSTGYVGNTLAPQVSAIDTSTGTATMKIAFLPAAANCSMELQDYTWLIRG